MKELYKVAKTFKGRKSGRWYKFGETIELDVQEAVVLRSSGKVVRVPGTRKESKEDVKESSKSQEKASNANDTPKRRRRCTVRTDVQ